MTRRRLLLAAAPAVAAFAAPPPLIVPIHRVMDSRAKLKPEQLRFFSTKLWPETVRDFGQCGIQFQVTESPGEIKRSPADRPIFTGLDRGAINLIVTDHIPMYWDRGRSLAGVTTIYDTFHLCVIALPYAHGNQAPFFSVNTCEHELLHALMQDVFVQHPKWYQTGEHEFRIDWYASRLWLFHEGAAVRQSAEAYVARLRAAAGGR